MSKKMDILTTLSKGIYKDDNYNVVDKQVVDMINEYYRRFKQDIEFQGRMNITILSLDNLDGDAGEDLRWKKIKEALPEVYDKDFIDFTLINCRNMQEIESAFVDHANFVYNTYNARTIVISRFKIFEDFLKSKDWANQAQFITWYDSKDEWLKSRIKTANYEDNLKIDDSVVVIDFDSLEDKINPYDIQKILNYRETNHKGKLTFILSDTKTVEEIYDILGLPCNYYRYIHVIGEDSIPVTKETFQKCVKGLKLSFICMNEEFLKKCETKDVYRTVYTITNNGITLVKKPKEMPRLSRPHFGDKSAKIEHKAALSQRWYFLLQENTWRDKDGNRHFVPNMSEDYIKNCILWLDETLCGKYIPDPELRRKFKALFQNELSHRDTLNRLCNRNINVKELLDGKKFINIDELPSLSDLDYNNKEKRVIKIYKRDDNTIFYLCEDNSIICRIEPHYENGSLLGGSQFSITPKDDEAYKNLLKKFENEPYLTSNIVTEKELLDGKKFQDLHSQMAIKCGIDVNDLPSMSDIYSQVAKEVLNKPYKEVKKESGRWSASEHNYNDLEKNVKKQKAYGTKYQNMSYNELVKQGLWKDTKNNIYTISSMRNGHIANILDMLNTNKYSLDMSPETKEKYTELFVKEFEIRNKLKNSEPQFLSKEEHNAFHTFNKKENDMIDHPNHYAQTRIECIDAIEACIEPYQDTVDAYLTSNALKYLWRHEFKKNPIEDLKKAVWYINRIIEKYEKGEIKSNK